MDGSKSNCIVNIFSYLFNFRQVDVKTGKLMIGRHMGALREGTIYSGGNEISLLLCSSLLIIYSLYEKILPRPLFTHFRFMRGVVKNDWGERKGCVVCWRSHIWRCVEIQEAQRYGSLQCETI